MQRTQDQQLMGIRRWNFHATASLHDDVEVAQPDVTPKCKAMVGLCQTRTIWMSAKVGLIQRLARLQTSSRSADATATGQEVGSCIWLVQCQPFPYTQQPYRGIEANAVLFKACMSWHML